MFMDFVHHPMFFLNKVAETVSVSDFRSKEGGPYSVGSLRNSQKELSVSD
jgi:hypothetical protein